MLVADLTHYLGMPDDAPGPAQRLADQLGRIVQAATAGPVGPEWVSAVPCTRRPGNRACPGALLLARPGHDDPIQWRCPACADAGTISNWADSPQQQSSKSSFRATVQNYAQDSSLLAGGRNTLNFAITPRGKATGKPALKLFEDSGLEVTTIAPDEVMLGVPRRPVSISTGRTADVPFTVRRRGGRPDQPVTVSIQASEGLEVLGPTRYDFDGIGSERTGSFTVKGATDGQYRVRISVSSKFNTAGNLVPIEVGPKPGQSLDQGTIGVIAALLGCSALFYFLSRRRRVT